MNLKFSKYQALGNDFVIVDYDQTADYPTLSTKLCDQKLGIGADGLIAVQNPTTQPVMHFFNADGSSAAMCGNGLRCVASYCKKKGQKSNDFEVMTGDGAKQIQTKSLNPFLCSFCLSKMPKIEQVDLSQYLGPLCKLKTDDNGNKPIVNYLTAGVPHAVLVDCQGLKPNANRISTLPCFAQGANVDFVTILDKNNITCTTYERGVGWTKACGTGAGASAYVTYMLGLTSSKVNVNFKLGSVSVQLNDDKIYLMGGATLVFNGTIKI